MIMILHLQPGQAKKNPPITAETLSKTIHFIWFFWGGMVSLVKNAIWLLWLYYITCPKTFTPKVNLYWYYAKRSSFHHLAAAVSRVKCDLYLAMFSNITKHCEVRMKDLFGPKKNLSKQNVITQLGLKPEWQG